MLWFIAGRLLTWVVGIRPEQASQTQVFSFCTHNRKGTLPVRLETALTPTKCLFVNKKALHWRHNDHDGVSNHQPHGCLLNRLFRRRSKKTSKLRVIGLCVRNSPGPVNSPHKGPVTRKMFPFDDVIMNILYYDPHVRQVANSCVAELKQDYWNPANKTGAPLSLYSSMSIPNAHTSSHQRNLELLFMNANICHSPTTWLHVISCNWMKIKTYHFLFVLLWLFL